MMRKLSLASVVLSCAGLACSGQGHGDTTASSADDNAALTADNAAAARAYASPWGYQLPLPFFQLSQERQALIRSRVQVDAVGAILTQQAPFRATAMYLGLYNGEFLFACADHIAIGSVPYAVELGYDATSANKFQVPLDPTPVFQSPAGDTAFYRAQDGLDASIAQRLQAIQAVQLSFAPLSALMQNNPDAQFVMLARGKYALAQCQIHGCSGQSPSPAWSSAAGKLWDQAEAEAQANEDPVTQNGDVLAVMTPQVLGHGLAEALRDPDGLTLGVPGGSPFLQSSTDWAPQSIAATQLTLRPHERWPALHDYVARHVRGGEPVDGGRQSGFASLVAQRRKRLDPRLR